MCRKWFDSSESACVCNVFFSHILFNVKQTIIVVFLPVLFSPLRQPVDDDLIEEALSDFASEEEEVEDKDSDFMVDGEEDSGSDWGSKRRKVGSIYSTLFTVGRAVCQRCKLMFKLDCDGSTRDLGRTMLARDVRLNQN